MPYPKTKRRGASILEIVCTIVLLAAVFAIVAPLMGTIAAQRKASDEYQVALLEVGNLMEQLTTRPWNKLTADSLSKIELPEETQQRLREAQLDIDVVDSDSDLPAKQITVQLSWKNRAGERMSPVRLSTWIYRQEEAE